MRACSRSPEGDITHASFCTPNFLCKFLRREHSTDNETESPFNDSSVSVPQPEVCDEDAEKLCKGLGTLRGVGAFGGGRRRVTRRAHIERRARAGEAAGRSARALGDA